MVDKAMQTHDNCIMIGEPNGDVNCVVKSKQLHGLWDIFESVLSEILCFKNDCKPFDLKCVHFTCHNVSH